MGRKNWQSPKCESETENLGNAHSLERHAALKAQWTVKGEILEAGGECTLGNIGSGILIEHIGVEIGGLKSRGKWLGILPWGRSWTQKNL